MIEQEDILRYFDVPWKMQELYKANNRILTNAIHGLELFEIPTAKLGTPRSLLDIMEHDSTKLAYWIGLGQVKMEPFVGYKGKAYSLDELLRPVSDTENQEQKSARATHIIRMLINNSYQYWAIQQLGNSDGGSQKKMYGPISNHFNSEEGKNDMNIFLNSMEQFQHTKYHDKRLYKSRTIRENANYLVQLMKEVKEPNMTWVFGDWKGRRMKFMGQHSPRDNDIYFTKARETPKGYVYECNCPAGKKEMVCWHVKELENDLNA